MLHLVGYLYYWQTGFNSVFKGLILVSVLLTIMFVGEDTDCVTDCFLGTSDYFFYWTKKEKSHSKERQAVKRFLTQTDALWRFHRTPRPIFMRLSGIEINPFVRKTKTFDTKQISLFLFTAAHRETNLFRF